MKERKRYNKNWIKRVEETVSEINYREYKIK